jgi:hypothetical protein
MIDLGRHRTLTHDAWSELAVRATIEEIAADAIANFHPDTLWPLHPSDEGVGDGNPSFYRGAAGVIWALDYLHRIGATRVAEDFRPVLPRLMERTIVDFESNAPAGYTKHGSLLRGDMGAALLAMRLAPTSSLADLVHTRAEANNGLPIRELMWGMPGSMSLLARANATSSLAWPPTRNWMPTRRDGRERCRGARYMLIPAWARQLFVGHAGEGKNATSDWGRAAK